MDAGLIWILVGLALLLAEMVLPGAFLLWIGLAAIGTGLFDIVFLPAFGAKVVMFLVLLAAGIAAALAIKKRRRPAVRVNTPDSGLVGRTGTVTERGGAGARVRIGDSDWAARISGEAVAGDVVRVDGVDGTVLIVRRLG